MLQITRRDSMKLASVTTLAALFGSSAQAAEEDKGEVIFVGPVSLGELYRSQKNSLGYYPEEGEGQVIGDEQIANAFDDCQLYVIDKKILDKSGKRRFVDASHEFPKLALSGKLHFEFKDNKDTDFKVYFESVNRVGSMTNYDTKPPTRYFQMNFQCHVVRGNLASEKDICRYGWSSEKYVVYDINGKVLPKKP
jgi:hypothetical protein